MHESWCYTPGRMTKTIDTTTVRFLIATGLNIPPGWKLVDTRVALKSPTGLRGLTFRILVYFLSKITPAGDLPVEVSVELRSTWITPSEAVSIYDSNKREGDW